MASEKFLPSNCFRKIIKSLVRIPARCAFPFFPTP